MTLLAIVCQGLTVFDKVFYWPELCPVGLPGWLVNSWESTVSTSPVLEL